MINKNLHVSASVLAACLAMGAISNSAHATITLYEKGPLTYQLKSDLQIQLKEDVGTDQDLNVDFDDLELKNVVNYKINDDLTALGELHFSYDNAARSETRDTSRLEEAFLGFKFSNAKVVIGKTNSAGDEFGVEKALESIGIDDDGFAAVADNGDDLIRLDASLGNVSIASSVELEADGEGVDQDKSFADFFISAKIGSAKIAAAYMNYNDNPASGSTDGDADVGGVSISFKAGGLNIGADYSTVDYEGNTDVSISNLAVSFATAPTTSVSLGVANEDPDGGAKVKGWYGNVTYKFPIAKNVRLFAEIGDNDKDDVDLGYVLGLRVLL